MQEPHLVKAQTRQDLPLDRIPMAAVNLLAPLETQVVRMFINLLHRV